MTYYSGDKVRNGYVTLPDEKVLPGGVRGDFYEEPDPISEQILRARGKGSRGKAE